MNWSLAWSKLPLGIVYFVAASLALSLTRYEGGVAFIWVACALLIADLLRTPRSRWLYSVVPCVIASGAATSLFGLGWQVAPLFMLLNAAEAVIAAWLIRRNGRTDRMLDSLASLWQFVLAAAIIAPLVAATLAGMILWWMGRPVIDGIIDVATGHALGNITFTPLAMLIARPRVAQAGRRRAAQDRRDGGAAAADGRGVDLCLHPAGSALAVPPDPADYDHRLSRRGGAHGHCGRAAGADRWHGDGIRDGTGKPV